jgi:hypothetical protein
MQSRAAERRIEGGREGHHSLYEERESGTFRL